MEYMSSFLRFYCCLMAQVDAARLVQVAMPLAESPQWRQKATDFFSTSGKFVFVRCKIVA